MSRLQCHVHEHNPSLISENCIVPDGTKLACTLLGLVILSDLNWLLPAIKHCTIQQQQIFLIIRWHDRWVINIMGCTMDCHSSISRECTGIFFCIASSRMSLGSIQPLIQWVVCACYLG